MITNRGKVKAIRNGLLAAVLTLSFNSVSQAGPLGVNIDASPDIIAQFITTTYNSTTGLLTASGWAMTLVDLAGAQQKITTNFSLQATINSAGKASQGSLTIGSAAAPLLASTNLTGFAFDAAAGGALEFLFGSPTGSYVPGTYSSLEPVDVMLSAGSGFLGSFASSWSGLSGTADIREDPKPVGNPEPSTLLLMLVGAAGLYGYRRKAVRAPSHC